MIKIAICDDDLNHNKKIEEFCRLIILKEGISISIKLFNLGEDLLNFYENNEQEKFDIIFLDIDMGVDKENGLNIATYIRQRYDNNVHIIFLTNYPQYMKDAFYVQASNYINKPLSFEGFKSEFKRIYSLMIQGKNNLYVVKAQNTEYSSSEDTVLNLNDVIYFISSNNCEKHKSETLIITKNNTFVDPIKIILPMSKITDDLKNHDFIIIMRGTLVNINHIASFICGMNKLKMDNGDVLSYTKGTLKKIKEEFNRVKLQRW